MILGLRAHMMKSFYFKKSAATEQHNLKGISDSHLGLVLSNFFSYDLSLSHKASIHCTFFQSDEQTCLLQFHMIEYS